jgi:AraC-like DNA-binding protein
MQQQKMEMESLPPPYPVGVTTLNQRTIEIDLHSPPRCDRTPAYHHRKSRGDTEPSLQLAPNSSQTKMQEVLTSVIGTHRIDPQDPHTDYRFDTDLLSTGNFALVNVQWQGAFKLEQEAIADRYIIYIALAGSLDQKIDLHQSYCCSLDTATIISPGQKLESIASNTGEALLISIDLQSINTAFGKLLDRSLKQPVIFCSSIDLTHELGLSLKKFVQFLWDAAAQSNLADFSSLVLSKLEKAFLSCLVEGLPSNYSDELLYQQDGTLACHVRKAQAFIEDHLQEDINLGDIAAATGVCSRLLQKAFAQHCGCSPMRFVTQARLQRIRRVLETATSDLKIVDVMMNYGLTQGGKFAREYHQLFGEKPSETLKRSCQISRQHSPLWRSIDDEQSDRVVGGTWYHQIPFSKYPKNEFFHFY